MKSRFRSSRTVAGSSRAIDLFRAFSARSERTCVSQVDHCLQESNQMAAPKSPCDRAETGLVLVPAALQLLFALRAEARWLNWRKRARRDRNPALKRAQRARLGGRLGCSCPCAPPGRWGGPRCIQALDSRSLFRPLRERAQILAWSRSGWRDLCGWRDR